MLRPKIKTMSNMTDTHTRVQSFQMNFYEIPGETLIRMSLVDRLRFMPFASGVLPCKLIVHG